MKPVSDHFRIYMEDTQARLVVYSPELDLSRSPDDLKMRGQLGMLREKFDGIVLYRCDEQTEQILSAAVSLGYRAALLTIWDPRSPEEIRTAARLVNKFHDKLALAVSIGSEGLMQERYDTADLLNAAELLQTQSRGGFRVEITTTEAWWLYLAGAAHARALRRFGDFLAPNIHVVWDTGISDPAEAAQWTVDRARELQASTRRLVLVREAGFPGGGTSPRAGTQFAYTRTAQAAFWRSLRNRQLVERAAAIPIVVFEAVDNPSKGWNAFESTWGLLDPEMRPYPVWSVFPALAAVSRRS